MSMPKTATENSIIEALNGRIKNELFIDFDYKTQKI